jgi:hypothetical protein
LSRTMLEALFIGIYSNLDKILNKQEGDLKNQYTLLLNDPLFSSDSLREGLASKDRLINRNKRAIKIFSE